jgi:hypothetical protein
MVCLAGGFSQIGLGGGLLDVRHPSIEIEFCMAGRFRDVSITESASNNRQHNLSIVVTRVRVFGVSIV